ncbi:head fiber protein [Paramixta manurensis]|uniref:head fiber protein n=1 Tax=Paramixta manurensis TaxID=2740817 RepID=UPI003F4980C0
MLSGGEYVLPEATSAEIGGVKLGAAVSNSAATDVDGVNTTLNALLASLRSAGVIASS